MKTGNTSNQVNTSKVTRFEIIDHRPCEECEGEGWVVVPGKKEGREPKQQQCIGCSGGGMLGRIVVVYDKGISIDVELQDRNRTLKVIINERRDEVKTGKGKTS